MSTPGDVGIETLVSALLPNQPDNALEELANATFIDAGVAVPVSPVDQLLVAFARRLLMDRALGGTGVVQLPRSRNRAALLLAITSHLLCRQAPALHKGPVVLVGLDIDLAAQLRTLSVANHRRMGLSSGNPLSAHRLTRAGDLQPVVGSAVGPTNSSLVYFNTRNGRPDLTCRPPLVVLDATSVTSPMARARALEWALDRQAAAIVAVGDIGDDSLIDTVSATGVVPTVLVVDEHVTESLVGDLGRSACSPSTLSSMSILWRESPDVTLWRAGSEDANAHVANAFEALAHKPPGPPPSALEVPLTLLRNGTRLAARVHDYRSACTNNVRPGESPNVRLLDRETIALPGPWRHWQTANLGALKVAVRSLWRDLEQGNPKLRELWRVVDHLERDEVGAIVVRCHSRAAAEATRASLEGGDRTPEQAALWERVSDRTTITTTKERFAAGTFEAQILTGAPPPWMLSLLVGIEAARTHILAYGAEEEVLRRQADRWAFGCGNWKRAACRTLGAACPPPVLSPIPAPTKADSVACPYALNVPGLSITDVLDAASEALDPPEHSSDPASPASAAGSKSCVPVHLSDGRTWWCVNEGTRDTPVVTLTAAGHENRRVGDLRVGDRILVPAGEGTESIHARLVTASRSNDDVQSLDLILSQFRSAARSLLRNRTHREASQLVRDAGAVAPDQLPAWAKGTTIAPREPGDVKAVFVAAGRQCPDLNLIYAVADTLRSLNRTLGRFVKAVASGRGEETVDQLRALVGDAADELLDEFVIAEVDSVGPERLVVASVAGRIR